MAIGNGVNSKREPRKTLVAVKDKQFPMMLRIQFEEGGLIPKILSGMYRKHTEAQKAIDDWNKGITRDKIYPKAPPNDIPTKLEQKALDEAKKAESLKPKVVKDGEAKSTS